MFDKLLHSAFTITPEMACGKIRNPNCAPDVTERLEYILRCFIEGYNLALGSKSNDALARELDAAYDSHHVGFAYEGAGMGLTVLDLLSLGRSHRLRDFVTQDGAKHDYIAMVGAGLAMARIGWGRQLLRGYLRGFDPLISWCVPDGYGFHVGFFSPERYVDRGEPAPRDFSWDARQLFDSGVGRSLWWTCGASPEWIAAAIDRFAEGRRPELWCGIGVACAYAGGDEGQGLSELFERAGGFQADFLSGLPFAARMRQKGGNASEVTEHACRKLLGRTMEEAAEMAHRLLQRAAEALGDGVGHEGYAFVRHCLTEIFAEQVAPPGKISVPTSTRIGRSRATYSGTMLGHAQVTNRILSFGRNGNCEERYGHQN
jgi:hypothetical protein